MAIQRVLDFGAYFLGLDAAERDALAADAGTSAVYLRDHLISGRRMPRARLLQGLVSALERRGLSADRVQLAAYFQSRMLERQPS